MNKHHPETTTITLLIAAERQDGLPEKAATVLARYLSDWSDERKADLYARLVEKLTADMTIAQMEQHVSLALWQNQVVHLEQ